MSQRMIKRQPWTRVFVDDPDDLMLAERSIEARLGAECVAAPERRIPLLLVTPSVDGAHVTEIEVMLLPEEIITIEPGAGMPLLQDVEARLLWDEALGQGPYGIAFAIVRAGYRASADSLTRIEDDIRRARSSMTVVGEGSERERGISVSDLPHVSGLLVDIDAMLSHVSNSVGQLTQFARFLRREAAEGSSIPHVELTALVQQGDALARRVEFLVDRHHFHASGTAQAVSTSDLNTVKIFTVLWAILIPGSTLINWYGQNFEVMPELSWEYSSWVQIVGVFCLAVLPIYTVKRAGQLR